MTSSYFSQNPTQEGNRLWEVKTTEPETALEYVFIEAPTWYLAREWAPRALNEVLVGAREEVLRAVASVELHLVPDSEIKADAPLFLLRCDSRGWHLVRALPFKETSYVATPPPPEPAPTPPRRRRRR